MQTVGEAVDAVASETGFSGVVRVDRPAGIEVAKAYGLADRAHEIGSPGEGSLVARVH